MIYDKFQRRFRACVVYNFSRPSFYYDLVCVATYDYIYIMYVCSLFISIDSNYCAYKNKICVREKMGYDKVAIIRVSLLRKRNEKHQQ